MQWIFAGGALVLLAIFTGRGGELAQKLGMPAGMGQIFGVQGPIDNPIIPVSYGAGVAPPVQPSYTQMSTTDAPSALPAFATAPPPVAPSQASSAPAASSYVSPFDSSYWAKYGAQSYVVAPGPLTPPSSSIPNPYSDTTTPRGWFYSGSVQAIPGYVSPGPSAPQPTAVPMQGVAPAYNPPVIGPR